MNPTRCGTAVLYGRPNAGKSTPINRILGERLSIVSAKPQTTRDRILGVYTDEQMQAVLLDTPGVHSAWTELNKVMVHKSNEAAREADVVLWLEDMTIAAGRLRTHSEPFDEATNGLIEGLASLGKPVIFVPNKVDVVPPTVLLPVLERVSKAIPLFAAVPISALTGDGVEALKRELARALPESPPMFPADVWTDVSERFLCAELIREKIFHLTEQEVPYAAAVVIESFDESERETRDLVKVNAAITVERPAQKAILIGKGGEMIKRIGSLARVDMQKMLGCRVHLELFVKVERDWSRTAQGLRRVGFQS